MWSLHLAATDDTGFDLHWSSHIADSDQGELLCCSKLCVGNEACDRVAWFGTARKLVSALETVADVLPGRSCVRARGKENPSCELYAT